ncbi:MAG: elongation factor P-like protein YeiP [Deltaproteobacteria bacterium]|nr:MAG: elongation factor P-like protein YeiP [Deltaproteobacteria bacterium]
MPKASELKKGNVVDINGDPYVVKHIDVKTPSARGAVTLYKVKFNNIKTGQQFEESYKGGDMLTDMVIERKSMQYLYDDGDFLVFMDSEDYAQYMLAKSDMEDDTIWLTDGMENLVGMIIEENLVGIEFPTSLVFEIVETAPAIKGASATARTKPATLSNGLEILVPEYLETGEKVKVNTETRKYMSRA